MKITFNHLRQWLESITDRITQNGIFQFWKKYGQQYARPFILLLLFLSFFGYAYTIRHELTVGKNKGNIKIVATKTKDSLSKGYKENVRTNLTINGRQLSKQDIIRNEWGEYGAGIPIPIFTADGEKMENQTLEIQSTDPIKNLRFEYSTYDVGGFLQVYLDGVLHTQINTYNNKLVYKPITLTFPQDYAITKDNCYWWLQLAIYLLLLVVLALRSTSPIKLDKKSLLLAGILFGASTASMALAFKYGETDTFYLSNTRITPTFLPIFLSLILILSSLVRHLLPKLRQYKLQLVGQAAYLALTAATPFISLYLIESAYSIRSLTQMSQESYQANILILIIIWFTMAFLTTSLRMASILLVAGSMAVGIATKILLISRNMPLLSYHFSQIRDGLSVVGDTDFSFTSGMFALIFTSWIVIILLAFLPPFKDLYQVKGVKNPLNRLTAFTQLSHFKKRLITKGGVALIGLMSLLFVARPLIYQVANGVDLSLYFWTMQSTYYDHGLPVALTRYHLASQIKEPDNYSASAAQDILAQYPRQELAGQKKPNIIFIMNESLTDYSRLTNLEFSSDPLAYIHSLNKNTVKGTTTVSVFAGSTANSEYEALTSNSLAILPPNAFPFQQYITSDTNSIVNYLEGQGYTTYATHPYGKDNYRRNQVYGHLGFDQSYFDNSSPGIKDVIEKPERIRGYISDASLYQMANQFMADSQEPVFNFIVTMQGHGGYSTPEETFPRTISITNAENDPAATDFLSSVDASDKAFEDFTKSLEASDEPTIVVMFGDHHPILTDGYFKPFLNASDPSSRYQTPFVMWANFDIPEAKEVKLSPNYIAPYLMQVLSQTDHALPISSYYQFLSEVQKEIPVMTTWGYYDAAGNYSEKSPESELYRQYQMIQYNNVMDKKALQMTDYYQ